MNKIRFKFLAILLICFVCVGCNNSNSNKKKVSPKEDNVTIKGNDSDVMEITIYGCMFKMIKVEAGTYTSSEGEKVTINKDFYIGETEVTRELESVVNHQAPYKGDDAKRAVGMSVGLVFDLVDCVNKVTGLKFRLPTNNEWEFAARGGNKSKGYKYSGSNHAEEVAWCKYTYTEDPQNGWLKNESGSPFEVAKKKPNELGLYDMSGNVWEIVSENMNPMGTQSVRGGGWYGDVDQVLIGARYSIIATESYDDVGLRLVLDVE